MTIIVLVVASVALLVYRLNRDFSMPVVSHGLSARQMPRVIYVQHSVNLPLHCIVAVLAPSFITASLQQFLWCSIVKRLEHFSA